MDVEKAIEFPLSNQVKHEERLTRLETIVISLAGSVEKLAEQVNRLDEAMLSLAESGVKTNQRIDQLGLRVDQLVSAVGTVLRQKPPTNLP